jgi:uncharacterized protein YjiK
MPKINGATPKSPPPSTSSTSTSKKSAATTGASFEPSSAWKTKMPEASDVVSLPGDRFLVVGDRKDQAFIIDGSGKRSKLDLPGLKDGKSQLEGVAYDPVRNHLFVSREESQELLRYEWNPNKLETPVLEKRIDLSLKGPNNKGVEGLAYLPSALSPTGEAQLLIAKEGKPPELSMLSDGGKGKPTSIKLEKEVLAVCRDFSAVAVDPKSGHAFLSSDESATVAEVKLEMKGDKVVGTLVQSFPLRDEKGNALSRVEGITFNEKGDLFVLTENDGKLRQLARK